VTGKAASLLSGMLGMTSGIHQVVLMHYGVHNSSSEANFIHPTCDAIMNSCTHAYIDGCKRLKPITENTTMRGNM
jgi:hypothetical protein